MATDNVAVIVTPEERDQLIRALVLTLEHDPSLEYMLPGLKSAVAKLARATGGPPIIIGVHGGLVQWVLGNPFPIRICDYDGEDHELPDIDEREQRCCMWFAPIDADWVSARWNRQPSTQSVETAADKL